MPRIQSRPWLTRNAIWWRPAPRSVAAACRILVARDHNPRPPKNSARAFSLGFGVVLPHWPGPDTNAILLPGKQKSAIDVARDRPGVPEQNSGGGGFGQYPAAAFCSMLGRGLRTVRVSCCARRRRRAARCARRERR